MPMFGVRVLRDVGRRSALSVVTPSSEVCIRVMAVGVRKTSRVFVNPHWIHSVSTRLFFFTSCLYATRAGSDDLRPDSKRRGREHSTDNVHGRCGGRCRIFVRENSENSVQTTDGPLRLLIVSAVYKTRNVLGRTFHASTAITATARSDGAIVIIHKWYYGWVNWKLIKVNYYTVDGGSLKLFKTCSPTQTIINYSSILVSRRNAILFFIKYKEKTARLIRTLYSITMWNFKYLIQTIKSRLAILYSFNVISCIQI